MGSAPGTVDWLDLGSDEELLWTGQPGAVPLVPYLVIGAGVALSGVFIAALLTAPGSPFRYVLIGLFVGFGLFVAGWRSAERRGIAYAITTDAVYEKRGPAGADVSTTVLADVESVATEESALAGLIGRGTVRCYAPAANPKTPTLDGISSPEAVADLLARRCGLPAVERESRSVDDTATSVIPGESLATSNPGTADRSGPSADNGADRPTDREDEFVWGAPADEDDIRESTERSGGVGADTDAGSDGDSNTDAASDPNEQAGPNRRAHRDRTE